MESLCPCAHPCPGVARNAPLLADSTLVSWSRGQELWAEGEVADGLLAVCTGALGLRRGTSHRRILGLVVRGEVVGEEAAVRSRRPASLVGVAAGKARLLGRHALEILVRRRPEAWRTLLALSCRRAADYAASVQATSRDPVARRLGAFLVDLSDRAGLADARGTMVPLRLSRRILGEIVGCREETVVRVMRSWEKAGALSSTREGLVLHDRQALLADNDPET